MKKILTILTVLLCSISFAQIPEKSDTTEINNLDQLKNATYANPQKFKLGGLNVVGNSRFTKSQISSFTGLRKGVTIDIPGSRINTAIKSLWKTNLFSDVEFFVSKIEGDEIFLNVNIVGLPELLEVEMNGVKKGRKEDFKKDNNLKPGIKVTESIINQTKNNIKQYYEGKGYPEATVGHQLKIDPNDKTKTNLVFNIDKGERIKIKNIEFIGNEVLSDKRLRNKGFKNTKRKNINILQSSKFIKDKYNEDLKSLIDLYKSNGFRDAKVVKDTVTKVSEDRLGIKVYVDEGKRYYLGDVSFVGNSVYSSEILQKVLSYSKGDAYDAVGISKKISGSEKDDDIAALYHNKGYLFSQIVPVEKNIKNDTIDLEIRIREGEPATWNRVTFKGNHVTHDHVISRAIQTKPGELFSRQAIKGTFFDLAGTGYFEPDQIGQDIQPNSETNTVDIEWTVAPKSSSQIQLQGGYGAGRFIGTLGLSFGNFSIGNLLKGEKWQPVPLGDGQTLSIQAQAGNQYSNYSLTFVEPWIGGRRPTSLSTSFFYSQYNLNDSFGGSSDLNIFGVTVGLNKRLRRPDRYFSLSQSISYRLYRFNNYNIFSLNDIQLNNGSSNNLSYNITFGRFNAGPNPIFPTSGSDFSVSLDLTLPYSLFNGKNYERLIDQGNFEEVYKWLEYYKVKAKAYWFKELIGKSVLRVGGEFGYLGFYNNEVGVIPFERFFLGGTGLQGNRFDGREIVPLRGYEDASNSGGNRNRDITPLGGGTVYNKYLAELRYPITKSQGATIYALTFFEAGNVWNDPKQFNPFELKRSAGFGIRIFMSAFGLLGFDFGYGFDPTLFGNEERSGWQTHFIFGQNL